MYFFFFFLIFRKVRKTKQGAVTLTPKFNKTDLIYCYKFPNDVSLIDEIW